MGISSVKRYVATYREGRSLVPKRPGSKPKLDDESARRLLEADLEERPAAKLPQKREFLRVCGVAVSDSTVGRMLGRLGRTFAKLKRCYTELRRAPRGAHRGDGPSPGHAVTASDARGLFEIAATA